MLEALAVVRVVSTSTALDEVAASPDAVVLRTAPDEMLVIDGTISQLDDPHAIVDLDVGWMGAWVETDRALDFLRLTAEWQPPDHRPVFVQGMVAELPAKLWIDTERSLLVVPRSLAAEMEDRLPESWRS